MAEQGLPLARPLEPRIRRLASGWTRRARARPRGSGFLRTMPLALFVTLALAGPLVVPASPTAQDLVHRLAPPVGLGGSWDHPLGTDGLGRDLLARIAAGARSSLLVGVVAALGAAAVGVVLGLVSGMLGGLVDRAVTVVVEVLMAVPFITFGIVVTATLGQSLENLLALLIASGWITHARIVRLQVRSLLRAEFVEAAVAMGATRAHVAWRHLVPHLVPVMVVVLCQQAGAMIIWSTSLTYLGIGLPVEEITLGGIVRDGQELVYTAWWVSVCGGLAIALAVAGFNLFADWLQRRLDPRYR